MLANGAMRPIVTLTMNPCIDLNLEVVEILFDVPMRATAQRKRAGGKGINVSVALAVLGVPSLAVAPLGGHSGREFEDLARSCFNSDFVQLRPIAIGQPTRTNTVISEPGGKQIKVNQQGPTLAESEAHRVVEELDRLVGPDSILALCGSLTPGLNPSFYAELIERFRQRGAFMALDTDGIAFQRGANVKPDLVKPNRHELAMWAGSDLARDTDFLSAILRLVDKTGGLCLATDGPNRAYLASSEEVWTADPLPAFGSPVGAGDCALAGLLSVLSRDGLAFHRGRALELALACGSASASRPDTEGLRLDDVHCILGLMKSSHQLSP